MYNFIDDLLERGEKQGIEKGIEKGKKLAIYEAYLRVGDIDLLSNLFALSAAEIQQIIEDMKNDKQ